MNRLRRTLTCCLGFFTASAQADTHPLLQQALVAEANLDARTALDLYLQLEVARPRDPTILQKIARQHSDLGLEHTEPAEQQRHAAQALAYAERAAQLAPDSAVNQLSLAICHARLALHADSRTKVEKSRLVRQFAERALALDPNYGYAHHVLGQWHHEVASIGPATRWLVKLIYGALPAASAAEAVKHLRRATELDPRCPAHHAELGLALLADGRRDEAKHSLHHALELPVREKYDQVAQRRAREALSRI